MIPAGNYGAGNVIIWDEGTWEFIEPGDDPVKAIQMGKLAFRMYGKKMFGEWALVKIKGRSEGKGNEWLLLKHRDEYASDKVDVTEVAPQSVVSGRTVEEVSPENVWISNRTSTRKAPTLASRLAAEKPRPTSAKKTSSRKTPAKKSPGPRAPSRAASARSRSSPSAPPKSARPTPRRRPR